MSRRFPVSCWRSQSGSFPNRRAASFDSLKETGSGEHCRGLARNPAFWTVTLGMAAGTFSLGGIQVWMPTFLSRARGYSLESANLIFGTIVVVDGILASLAGGWLGDRLLAANEGFLLLRLRGQHGPGRAGHVFCLVHQGAMDGSGYRRGGVSCS